MRRTGLFLVFLLVGVIPIACGRTADERAAQQQAALQAQGQVDEDEVKITGCLTSAPDRNAYVVSVDRHALTSGTLTAATGETPTYAYELVGNAAELSAHVGQQVEVIGRLDDARDEEVQVDQEAKTTLPSTRSGRDVVTPAIETDTEMEINVRRMQVSAVSSTGRSCHSGDF